MEGWIKIYRKMLDHWIWKNPLYAHAWITILMTVNFETKTSLIQGELIECERGQSILSLKNWTDLFGRNWTIQKTRTFFDLLKTDQMINTEGLHKTTRLTVCNYDDYQDSQQTDNTPKTSTEQTDNTQITTTKERKKEKNDNNEKNNRKIGAASAAERQILFYNSLKNFSNNHPPERLRAFYNYWSELTQSGSRMRMETEKTWETSKRLTTWASREKEKINGNVPNNPKTVDAPYKK